jgi:hypothetical protein
VNRPAAEALTNKIQEYLALDRHVKSVNVSHARAKLVPLEAGIVKSLIGYSALEELIVSGETPEICEQLAQLLIHPDCRLKVLRIDCEEFTDHSRKFNVANFPDALLKTTAPLESVFISKISDEQLATSLSHMCTRPNGLKKFEVGTRFSSSKAEALIILLRGVVTSKTLEEISLFDVGRKEVIEGNKRKYVNALNDELIQLIGSNLSQNPSLRVINSVKLPVTPKQLSKILQVPSLREIKRVDTTDLSFLRVTRLLEKVMLYAGGCTPEQAEYLRKFLADKKCPLKDLDLSNNNFTHAESIEAIARGLAKNKSLRILNLSNIRINSPQIAKELRDSLVQRIESSDCNLIDVNLSQAYGLQFQDSSDASRILVALCKNKSLTKFQASIDLSADQYQLLMDLINNNSSLTYLSTFSKHHRLGFNVSDDQVLALQAAVNAKKGFTCHFSYRFFDKNSW